MSNDEKNTIIPRSVDNTTMLMPHDPNKDQQSRLVFFVEWLDDNGLQWTNPCLADYRNFLLHEGKRRGDGGLAPATVSAHLATIRGRYAQLLRDNRVRDQLYSLIPRNASPADRKAFVDEALARLQNAVHPSAAPVSLIKKQDVVVDWWVQATGVSEKAIFRGIRKGGKSPYPSRITTRSVNRILNKYVISIDGVPRQVKPHDLRRTYARRAYEMGMDVLRIQQNLGHSSTDTTLRYIGTLDADLRRPPEMFDPPFVMNGL